MSPTVERLKSEIAALSAEERAELTDFLMSTLGPDQERELEMAWVEELQRRDAELSSGQVQGIPGEQVFERLREKYS